MDYEFQIGSSLHAITLEARGEGYLVTAGETTFVAQVSPLSPNALSILIDGRSYTVYSAGEGNRHLVFCEGHYFELIEPSEDSDSFLAGEGSGAEGELMIKAPMPGKIIKISVSEDEEVRKNQTLVIVEAMKMENEIKSTIEGVVKRISASPGDLVDTDTPIIELIKKE
ncbi:MAG: biotin/lipoyl-containing protein [Candidatus Aminicenantaceae bacterium]